MKHHIREKSYMHEYVSKLLGISPSLYPEQSKTLIKILGNFRDEYKNMVQLHNCGAKSSMAPLFNDIRGV